MKIREIYIKRCIQLAKNGLSEAMPNPSVGAVLVYNNKVIGEGFTSPFGGPHAEVNAINSVKDKSLLKKAALYVSLEPCSHFGKTPPCTNLITASGIKKVIIGMVDPFSKVAGSGIKKLMDAGCEVQVGVLEEECQEVLKRFVTFHLKNRPYIILKWAQSEDGFIAPALSPNKREPVWISNKYSKQLVHKWRAEEQAILVGTNTAVADNPQLNTRLWNGKNPVRSVIDQHLRVPENSMLFDKNSKTIVICGKGTAIKNQHENLIFEAVDFKKELAIQISRILFKHDLQSLIIEGGRHTLQTFIDAELWDEARVFTGTPRFKKGVKAPEISGQLISEEKIGSDILKIYRND